MTHGVIYVHINKENGRCYVGQTWQNTERRWRKTSKAYFSYKNTEVFYKALQKYTWEGFESKIICECTTQEEMNRMEEFYIKQYNSLAPNGYNLRDICDGREKHTEETKEKIRQKATGRKRDSSWNKLNIIVIEGKNFKQCGACKQFLELETNFSKSKNHYYCQCHKCKYKYSHGYIAVSEDVKQESFKQRGEKFKQIHGTPQKRAFYKQLHSKPIQQLDLMTKEVLKEYSCAKDASLEGFKGPGISNAIKTKGHYKGFYWQFKL